MAFPLLLDSSAKPIVYPKISALKMEFAEKFKTPKKIYIINDDYFATCTGNQQNITGE